MFIVITALLMSLTAATVDAAPRPAVAQFQPFKIGDYESGGAEGRWD